MLSSSPKPVVKPEETAMTPPEAPDPFIPPDTPSAIPGVPSGADNALPDGSVVQLGAFRSQAEAEEQWTRIYRSHMDKLDGLMHRIVRADLGAKGIYYRLRVGGIASKSSADELCATLTKRGQGCFPVSN